MPHSDTEPETNKVRQRQSRRRLVFVLWTSSSILLPLLILEASLRLYNFYPPENILDNFLEYVPAVPLFIKIKEQDGVNFYRKNPKKLSYRDDSFLMPKPEGTLRIFCLGASSLRGLDKHGHIQEKTTIPWLLEERLKETFPERHIEVISAAAPALNSTQLLVRSRELARYEPDLFVIYSGHNEWAASRWDADYVAPSTFVKLQAILLNSRVAMLLRATSHILVRYARQWTNSTDQLFFHSPPGGPVRAGELDAVARNFEKNLSELTDIARAGGAKVVLCTIASNLIYQPTGLCQEETDECDGGGPAGVAYMEAQQLIEAGRMKKARAALEEARDKDRVPLRAPSRINAVLRNLSADEGIHLADTENAVKKASTDGLSGFDMFVDSMHPTVRGSQVIADCIAKTILSMDIHPSGDRGGPSPD